MGHLGDICWRLYNILTQFLSFSTEFSRRNFYYGTRLAYAAISGNLSMSGDDLNYNVGMEYMDAWNSLIDYQVRTRWFICVADDSCIIMSETQ